MFLTNNSYGNDEEFGAVAGAVIASSQPMLADLITPNNEFYLTLKYRYGNDDAAGFAMTGSEYEDDNEPEQGVDGYLDINPDGYNGNDNPDGY